MVPDFRVLLRVRYAECDAQGVVFNARYGDYVDLAMTEFMRALLGGYATLLARGLDTQVVRLATDWSGPARFDEVLALRVRPLRLGNTSFTLHVDIRGWPDERAVAVSEITYVLVSAGDHRKQPLPDDLRAQLTGGAAGITVDLAGTGEIR
jgi:acyl-CoA thioester hydrolase